MYSQEKVTVEHIQPELSVTPNLITVSSANGTASFNVSNTGTGDMAWTAHSNDPWIGFVNSSGINDGAIEIAYQTNSGEPRVGYITVQTDDALNSPQTIEIRQASSDNSILLMNEGSILGASHPDQWNVYGDGYFIGDDEVYERYNATSFTGCPTLRQENSYLVFYHRQVELEVTDKLEVDFAGCAPGLTGQVGFNVELSVDGMNWGPPRRDSGKGMAELQFFNRLRPSHAGRRRFIHQNQPNTEPDTATVYIEKVNVKITPGVPPTISLTQLDGVDDTAGQSFEIAWTDEDPDSNAQIFLYYDTDNQGEDGTPINQTAIEEDDETDTFQWNTSTVEEGDYFIYAVIDDGIHDPATVYSSGPVTVNHNDAPVAINDVYSVNEGGDLTITAPGVLVNDTDANNDSLYATLVSGPTHGTLTLNDNGSFSYTHDGSETTSDSFVYKAFDGEVYSETMIVNITIQETDPEIDIQGNGISIANGDDTPSISDHTDFGNVIVGGSRERTFTIVNTGNDDLIFNSTPYVSVSGERLFHSNPTNVSYCTEQLRHICGALCSDIIRKGNRID